MATGAAVLGWTGSAHAEKPLGELRLTPDLERMVLPYQVEGRATSLRAKGVHLRVAPLDEAGRASYFALRTSLGFDPLPTIDRFPRGWTVFELSFRNTSGRDLRFIPAGTACKYDRDFELLPYHFDQLLGILSAVLSQQPDPQAAALKQLSAFFVEPLLLHDGEQVTRLMVYEGSERKVKELHLELGQLFVGDEFLTPTFHYLAHRGPPPTPQSTDTERARQHE